MARVRSEEVFECLIGLCQPECTMSAASVASQKASCERSPILHVETAKDRTNSRLSFCTLIVNILVSVLFYAANVYAGN